MTEERIPWHDFSVKDSLERLDSSPQGLTDREAILRLKKYGPNEPVKQQKRNDLIIFLTQFQNPLVYLLIFAAVITYFLKHNLDTIIIMVIVFFNALIGYFQEKKAEKSMEALKKLISLKARVIRDNEKEEISALELVPGDIVVIEEGMKISADIRLIESENLKIDESTLTGESIPVHKKIGLIKNETPLADRTNMLFAGTVVSTGHGLGVVVETAGHTELAQIAEEVITAKEEITPLHKKLAQFSRKLLLITILVCLAIFLIGAFQGLDIIEMFLTTVAAAVSIIPEGLPAVISITLAVGVYRMAQRKAIIRKLTAVETLGSVTVIAADKTGTLTHNQMTLEKIFVNKELIQVSGEGYQPEGEFTLGEKKLKVKNQLELKKFLNLAVLCNNASLIEKNQEWKILGDPTEGSLIVAAAKAGYHKEELNKKFPRLDEIPFQSETRFMATLHQDKIEGKNLIAVKGTMEKILASSPFIFHQGKIKKLTAQEKRKILTESQEQSLQAYRILAIAFKEVPKIKEKLLQKDIADLIFVGFCDLEDPPREEAIEAVKSCQEAGIRTIMITGDYPATAKAIAQKLAIAEESSTVISGEELAKMSARQLKETITNVSVYARMTPEMKLKIVETLEEEGEIVGVTGDGVNDAPILKRSDVGIAMGQGGTDVAREASDMVLVDNNFATIVGAIEEGRTIFQNIRRAVFFLLSTNAGEALILFVSLLMGLPLPLTAVQILWINLITDSTGCLALAREPKHVEVMKFKPRSPEEGILTKITNWRIALVAMVMLLGTMSLYYAEIQAGASMERARTIAFITMAVFQILNILNSRSLKTSIFGLKPFSNPYVTASFILMIILTIITVQIEFFRDLFHTVSLSLNDWGRIFLVSFSVIVVVEMEKFIRNLVKSKY